MVATPSKTIIVTVPDSRGWHREQHVKTFLWDNPELRKAYTEASERERSARKPKRKAA